MRRAVALALVAAAALGAPPAPARTPDAAPPRAAAAAAPVRLAGPDRDVVGLTVAGAAAFALLDPGEADGPFSLVRVSGARAARVAVVGAPGSEFPMLAARGRRVATAWDQPISGGVVYLAQARRAAAPSDVSARRPGPVPVCRATGAAARRACAR